MIVIVTCVGRSDSLTSHLHAKDTALHDLLALANGCDTSLHLLGLIDSDKHGIEVFVGDIASACNRADFLSLVCKRAGPFERHGVLVPTLNGIACVIARTW